MPRIATLVARTDAFCARLNLGLVAVVMVLAILTGALSIVRAAQWLEPFAAEYPEATVE